MWVLHHLENHFYAVTILFKKYMIFGKLFFFLFHFGTSYALYTYEIVHLQ